MAVLFSIATAPFYIPVNRVQGPTFSTSMPALLFSVCFLLVFNNSPPNGCEIVSLEHFDHLFLCLVNTYLLMFQFSAQMSLLLKILPQELPSLSFKLGAALPLFASYSRGLPTFDYSLLV